MTIRSSAMPPLPLLVIFCFGCLMLLVVGAGNWLVKFVPAKDLPGKAAPAPFEMENGGTTADLRGIHAAGGPGSSGAAWASGANGTVLRTEDMGFVWQTCSLPPGAEKLDFRAIWGWDANAAVVMSSGPGDQSRIYKTTDGCSHWTLLYTNPDPKGFWDAMSFTDQRHGTILGDPVNGAFVLLSTDDGGLHWHPVDSAPANPPGEAAFAASNSSLTAFGSDSPSLGTGAPQEFFGTGGKGGPRVLRLTSGRWDAATVPLASGTGSAGVFSLAFRDERHGIAAGGDYQKPNTSNGTAAWTADGGKTWTAAAKPPHGYRSAVAWDEKDRLWIATGTNGADMSEDDGKTWTAIDNGDWNAISLPWVVGPGGRIAKLISLNLPNRAGNLPNKAGK